MKNISKLLLATLVILTLGMASLPACAASKTVTVTATAAAAAKVQPSETNPIVIDPVNREIRIAAKVNGVALTQPTWHAVVYSGGKAAASTLFQAFVTPAIMYNAFAYFGGTPGNNMPPTNYSSTNVKGSDISITVTWAGAPKTYNLIDVVKDPDGAAGKGIQMKFGGNYDNNATAGTGCISCFYSCPIGISSNSAYNGDDNARQAKAGQGGFLGNSTILPPDGTPVVLTYKVTP